MTQLESSVVANKMVDRGGNTGVFVTSKTDLDLSRQLIHNIFLTWDQKSSKLLAAHIFQKCWLVLFD